eukprot:14518388-Ditylum_brightwellii.AAC.1
MVKSDNLLIGTLADLSQLPNSGLLSEDWEKIKALTCELDTELIHQHPSSTYIDVVALAASKSGPDTPSFKEVLSGVHTAEFKEVMNKEVGALQKRRTWTLIPKFKLPES